MGADGEGAVKNDTQFAGLSSSMNESVIYRDRKNVDLGLTTKNSAFEYIKFEISMRHPRSQMGKTTWHLWEVGIRGNYHFISC